MANTKRVRTYVAAAAFLAVLVSACAGSEGENAADTAPPAPGLESSSTAATSRTTTVVDTTTTTTTTTTGSTSTTVASTTSTTAAPIDLPDCPAGQPLAVADLDGDGVDENLLITERDGGQVLWACGPDGGRSLDLEYAVWYLAVTDVEPDGVDEVFLGAASIYDAPGAVGTRLHRVEQRGGRLEAYTGNYTGIPVGSNNGAGCIDVDGDGVRELMRVWVDTEASTNDTVVWQRAVASAIPFDERKPISTGEFTVGGHDAAIALLSSFSCGDDLVDLIRVQPPRAICEGEAGAEALVVDLDRDGIDDLVRQRRSDTGVFSGASSRGPAVAVCLGAGLNDEVLVFGMGEVFNISTGPGGQPVVMSGGTSAWAAFSDPMVVENGRLLFVRGEDGMVLTLWDGYSYGAAEWGGWGCSDMDGDGREEFVQVVATFGDVDVSWTRDTWSLQGATAVAGPTDSGSLPGPADIENAELVAALNHLVPNTC